MKPETMRKRLLDCPDQFSQVKGSKVYFWACSTNVGSCKSDVKQRCLTMLHTTKVQVKIAGSQRGIQLLQCITCYKGIVSSKSDGKEPARIAAYANGTPGPTVTKEADGCGRSLFIG